MTQEDLKDLLDNDGIEYTVSGDEIQVACPHCGTHKHKYSLNIDKNASKCWICGESGNINKALASLGITDFEAYSGPDSEVEDVVTVPYLQSRGFKPSTDYTDLGSLAKTLRIDYRASQELVSKAGKKFTLNNLLRIRYQGLREDGYTNSGYKYRSLDPDSKIKWFHDHKEHAPKYYIANLDRFKESKELVITEGEIDAASLELFGFNSLASTGIQKTDYVKDLYRFERIYFIPDNDSDPKVRNQVKLAMRKTLALIKNEYPEIQLFTAKLPTHIKDVNEALDDYKWEKDDFNKVLAKAEEYLEGTLLRSGQFYLAKMSEFLQDDSKSQGLPTGIAGIDQALGGGERLGEIDALVARAKSGKNSLYHQMMYMRLASGTPIGYLSRELKPSSEVLPNLFSIEFGLNFWTLKKDDPDKFKTVVEQAAKRLASWPIYFSDGLGIMSIEEIAQFVREAKKQGVNYFYLDHFHRCMLDSEDRKEIARFISDLKRLVSEENIHLNLIVQPTKVGDRDVSYSDMRGSVVIEQEVDQLWQFNRTEDKNITRLTLAAARHRLAKPNSDIYFAYDPTTTRMTEIVRTEQVIDTSVEAAVADYRIENR